MMYEIATGKYYLPIANHCGNPLPLSAPVILTYDTVHETTPVD